jgi:hypothetical protein
MAGKRVIPPEIFLRDSSFGRLCRFGRTLQALEQRCPAYIEPADWRQAVADGLRIRTGRRTSPRSQP